MIAEPSAQAQDSCGAARTTEEVQDALLLEEARERRAQGNNSGAFARYRRLLDGAVDREDHASRLLILREVGEMYAGACDLLPARRFLADALVLAQELRRPVEEAALRLRLAQMEHISGDLPGARELYVEAAAAFEKLGEGPGEAAARSGLGQLLWQTGSREAGLREALAALRLYEAASLPGEAAGVAAQLEEWRRECGSAAFRRLTAELR